MNVVDFTFMEMFTAVILILLGMKNFVYTVIDGLLHWCMTDDCIT